MREIRFKNNLNKVALVDDEDFDRVSRFNWVYHLKDSGNEYAEAWVGIKTVSLHRFILKLKRGDGRLVEHKNGNGLDCQKLNLILGSYSHNNSTKRGITGIFYNPANKNWRAVLQSKGKRYDLGSWPTEDLALLARIIGEIKYLGYALNHL